MKKYRFTEAAIFNFPEINPFVTYFNSPLFTVTCKSNQQFDQHNTVNKF